MPEEKYFFKENLKRIHAEYLNIRLCIQYYTCGEESFTSTHNIHYILL